MFVVQYKEFTSQNEAAVRTSCLANKTSSHLSPSVKTQRDSSEGIKETSWRKSLVGSFTLFLYLISNDLFQLYLSLCLFFLWGLFTHLFLYTHSLSLAAANFDQSVASIGMSCDHCLRYSQKPEQWCGDDSLQWHTHTPTLSHLTPNPNTYSFGHPLTIALN